MKKPPQPLLTIVGTGPGVSLAVARRFHREGFRLALIARSADKVRAYAEELRGADAPDVRGYTADVTAPAAVAATFREIEAQQGATDVLVYNPSAFRETVPSELDFQTLVDDFKISCAGLLPSVQAVLPAMRARGGGKIFVTGGGTALEPYPLYASLGVG
ncbi:MAG: SDR family NAD(P)-dependent oxidoreductase, partial [Catalinimonas sp.]